MITNLAYLGIYPSAIDSAINSCEAAMKKVGMSISEIEKMNEMALEEFQECGSLEDITNSIIRAYFDTTQYLIVEKFPGKKVDYFVNCEDSHFFIDGEEMW